MDSGWHNQSYTFAAALHMMHTDVLRMILQASLYLILPTDRSRACSGRDYTKGGSV